MSDLNHGEPVEFEWTRKRHDIRQAAKRFLEGDETMTAERIDKLAEQISNDIDAPHDYTELIARRLVPLLDKLKATEEALIKAKDQETELYTENGQLRFLLQQCQNSLEHTSQCNACQAKTDTLIDDINAQLGKRDARDDAVAHWKKEVAAAREILDSCRENTNYWMEVDTDLRGERNRARYLLKECRPWVERKHSTHHAYCGCELLKQIDEELGEVE